MARPRVATGRGQKPVSRLKLEPLDLSSGRDPLLKSSAELLSTPAATEQERSAAAALWRAVSAQPEDILRDLEKLQALQNSVRGLQMETQKGQLSVQDMNSQVQQARAERYANPLVYALGALLLLALAALAYVLLGRRTVHQREGGDAPWWRKNEPAERGGWSNSLRDAAVSATQVRSNALSSGAKNSVKGDLGEGSAGLDLDLNLDAAESGFTQVEQLYELPDSDPTYSPWRHNRQDFSSSMPTVARAVKAEELFDVQQQADFFVSLGQNDQAIEVLKEHIGDNVKTSALVYLDLFDLYHQLNRKEDYEALREDFDKRFNATMPAFEFYKDSGPGLEAYQGALTRIEALWPSSKVLDIIEESIFRSPDTTATAFDLEAYRELLLLYAVAKEIINPHAVAKDEEWHSSDNALDPVSGGAVGRSAKFAVTSIQPLPSVVVGKEQRAVISSFDLDGPPASSDLGLDLDLTDFSDDTSDLTADSKPNATAPSPAAQVPEAPPYLVSGMGNLIDFDAFDYSVDTSKAKPGTKG